MWYLYLDESGDLGFDFVRKKPSRFFTVTILLVEGMENNRTLINVSRRPLLENSTPAGRGVESFQNSKVMKRRSQSRNIFMNSQLTFLLAYLPSRSTSSKHLMNSQKKNIAFTTIFPASFSMQSHLRRPRLGLN